MENRLNEAEQQEIIQRLDAIEAQIQLAVAQSGRRREEIALMAVTKTQTPEKVNLAISHGITLLGENRAQELLEKFEDYQKENCNIHFIGHLQTNKVRQIIDKVQMIHSVGSLHLAQEISTQALQKLARPMDILIEINIGGEESKGGIAPDALDELLGQLSALSGIRVRGLMCIPPICENTAQLEGYFEKMHQLFIDRKAKTMDNICMDFLSMGMSGDYLYAIKHGTNIVRLGSAIFGKRNI